MKIDEIFSFKLQRKTLDRLLMIGKREDLLIHIVFDLARKEASRVFPSSDWEITSINILKVLENWQAPFSLRIIHGGYIEILLGDEYKKNLIKLQEHNIDEILANNHLFDDDKISNSSQEISIPINVYESLIRADCNEKKLVEFIVKLALKQVKEEYPTIGINDFPSKTIDRIKSWKIPIQIIYRPNQFWISVNGRDYPNIPFNSTIF